MSDKMTGAEALIKVLEEHNVDTIFGYPGGAVLPIYDALRNSKIKHVLARHEQGAALMANGYARIANRPAVCLATSGPGATNLVTGLSDALLDSVPMVAITGQIVRSMVGKDAFQEVDCLNITMPVTKHNELVINEDDLVSSLEAAFHIADTGRKGPVLLDLPKDLLQAKHEHKNFGKLPDLPGYKPTEVGDIGQKKRAIRLLRKAERPLLLIGGGVTIANAAPEVIEFIKKTNIPVVRTMMGKGVISDEDPIYLGMIGSHGNVEANRAVRNADVVLALGTRFGDRSTLKVSKFAQEAKIIQVDIDPAEIGKSIPVKIPIVGNIKEVMSDINLRLKKKPLNFQKPWMKISEERKLMLSTKHKAPILGEILTELSNIDQKLHVSTDVGRHQVWAVHYCKNMKHLPLLTSGGLGTMGFGLPAAIGAWFADPETPVVNITGDGSFLMNMQEFIVAVEHNIPLTIILMNDSKLSMIRELQDGSYDSRYAGHDLVQDLDYVMMARSMGGEGVNVTDMAGIAPALNASIESGKPTIINFDINKIHDSMSSKQTA